MEEAEILEIRRRCLEEALERHPDDDVAAMALAGAMANFLIAGSPCGTIATGTKRATEIDGKDISASKRESIKGVVVEPTDIVRASEEAAARDADVQRPDDEAEEPDPEQKGGGGKSSLPPSPPQPAGHHRPSLSYRGASEAPRAPNPEKPHRRFHKQFEAEPEKVKGLSEGHPALKEKRTIFPTQVVNVKDSPGLLVSGANQRKIGDRVTKGPWEGMPIYTLTLEERATCPTTCHHWGTCYGNGMHRARRHRHGEGLERRLAIELAALDAKHPDGFVVRLHILGDFYSVEYVAKWADWLKKFPALHVFGYTAWAPDTAIGRAINAVTGRAWDRFAIRVSAETPEPGGATTIWRKDSGRVPEGVVCPAQTHEGVSCGSCGLCWNPETKDDTIAFIAHGNIRTGRPKANPLGPGATESVYSAIRSVAINGVASITNDTLGMRTGLTYAKLQECFAALEEEGRMRREGERRHRKFIILEASSHPDYLPERPQDIHELPPTADEPETAPAPKPAFADPEPEKRKSPDLIVNSNGDFPTPRDRRCQGCQEIFPSRRPSETFCRDCRKVVVNAEGRAG